MREGVSFPLFNKNKHARIKKFKDSHFDRSFGIGEKYC